jgi:hypothetical protein
MGLGRWMRGERAMKMQHRKVIRIGADGTITLSMPEMADQYIVIEEDSGHVILKPFDLRWHEEMHGIARIGQCLHFVPRLRDSIPEA